MPVTIGARREHGFDEPLGLLSDCHRRIENFLEILQKVVQQAHGKPLNDQQRRAVDVTIEYFRSAAPRHTADEEQSLFPRLRESSRPDLQAAMRTIDALEQDHVTADAEHARIDADFAEWIARGTLPADRQERLRVSLDALRELYRRHIAIEDQEIFPLAAQVLAPEQLAKVGTEMAHRRGLAPKP